MKKYTNKILLITLITIAALIVIVGTVEIQTAWRSGKIEKMGKLPEIYQDYQQNEVPGFLEVEDQINIDTTATNYMTDEK